MRRRHVFGAAAGVAAAATLLGGVLAGRSAESVPAVQPQATADRLLDGFAAGDTAARIAALEQRVEATPEDPQALTLLGLAYQQRVRETGDASLYPRSEDALRRALALDSGNALAATGRAALAAARHDFREARRLAERALELDPYSAPALGILGDAAVETGRYEAAFAAFDRMAALKPSVASYSRIAYARELLGMTAAAVQAMKLAVSAGAGLPEPQAWALVELGNLYYNSGRLRPAERAYREALARFPGYHRADAGLARAAAARGRIDEAVVLYRRALDAVPLPEYAARLAETLAAAGREAGAAEAYELVDVIQRLFEANGARTELETALVDLDRNVRLEDALSRARGAYAERRSIEAEDVLGWALARNGRCEEALVHARRALRLGTRDALKLFHLGMIERCLGRPAAARGAFRRALAVNPYFSPRWAPVAREAIR
ncbi:MAG TPA: tetratricopeptide repeat protein [Gaiellaceae bacterium]|nr:tetratricopeptide repeat protein [Gaiellaceae bacterium]